jgi:hypothetical protein
MARARARLLYGARLQTQNEQAEKLRLENLITTTAFLNKDALSRAFAELSDNLSQAVMSSDLNRQPRETFLRNLSG